MSPQLPTSDSLTASIEDQRSRYSSTGHLLMRDVAPISLNPAKLRSMYHLSDPALSELSLDEFLSQIMGRVVEVLNVDTATVLLLDDRREVLVARASSGVEAEVVQRARVPVGVGFAGRVAAGRVPIAISDVEGADIVNPVLQDVGLRSLLGVPLIVEGELIGVLHVGSLTPRSFSQEDLGMLQLVAARIAPGIARATLVRELQHEHELTLMLQRSLLPQQLVKIPELEIAAGYIAATDEAGGDWYDAFALEDGRIGVTVGDVVGNGIHAATLMGQLRTSLRAYAMEGHSPAKTLELVNRFALNMSSRPIATAIYAVIDPTSGESVIASAGHLPPALLSRGDPTMMVVTPGPPLGAFPDHFSTETQFGLQPAESLVLYSDGLIERRGVPMDDSFELLLSVVGDATSAVQICTNALHHLMPPEGLHDDAAILAVRRNPD